MAVNWAHVLTVLVLGLGMSSYDVGTDGLNGFQFLTEHDRFFPSNATIPPHCVAVGNMSGHYSCRDVVWGILTIGLIQLPGVVLAVCAAGALMMFKCKHPDGWYGTVVSKRMVMSALSLAIIPYPLVVWIFHLYCLCHGPTPQLELMSSVLLLGEGSLEAAPQLTLQLYIIMSNPAMAVTWTQYLAIISAFLSIAKTSIELFLSESGEWLDIDDFMKHGHTFHDSLLTNKPFLSKVLLLVKISPAFLASLFFKTGTMVISITLLRQYSAVYIVTGVLATFCVAWGTYDCYFTSTDNKLGYSVFYSGTNICILTKCPLNNRRYNYNTIMRVSLVWMIWNSITLITLMVLYTSYPHLLWSNTIFSTPAIFYTSACSVLVLGPVSVFLLWVLRGQIRNIQGEQDYWNPGRWRISTSMKSRQGM